MRKQVNHNREPAPHTDGGQRKRFTGKGFSINQPTRTQKSTASSRAGVGLPLARSMPWTCSVSSEAMKRPGSSRSARSTQSSSSLMYPQPSSSRLKVSPGRRTPDKPSNTVVSGGSGGRSSLPPVELEGATQLRLPPTGQLAPRLDPPKSQISARVSPVVEAKTLIEALADRVTAFERKWNVSGLRLRRLRSTPYSPIQPLPRQLPALLVKTVRALLCLRPRSRPVLEIPPILFLCVRSWLLRRKYFQ